MPLKALRDFRATLSPQKKVMPEKPIVYDEASDVKAVDGFVEVDGPDAVDVILTAEAAEETSERLLSQAFNARGQRRLKRYPHRPDED
jgi:hypothetical protein